MREDARKGSGRSGDVHVEVTPFKPHGHQGAASGSQSARTPAVARSRPGSQAGTPLGHLVTFSRAKARAGQSWSEPSTPHGSRPCSLADLEGSSLAELLDEEASPKSADNVRVLVRLRPLSQREQAEAGERQCATASGQAVILSDPNRPDLFVKCFDHVFGPEATQEDVHQVAGASSVEHVIAGFNCSVFAYGQTGSGKTYTMQGGGKLSRGEDGQLAQHSGLTMRVFDALFSRISEEELANERLRYSVKCSLLEVYNEEISDLLQPTSTGLQIRDGDLSRGVYVEGLTERSVLNADDVMALIEEGSANRHIACTKMNERSSRSHSVFTAHVIAHEKTESGLTNVRYSKLNLIDLAGSERVGKSGVTGGQLAEAKNINKSLTCLGRVITALGDRQRNPKVHVPYRDSRLTFLLQESLGGNSRSCIIANCSPGVECAQETHSTLVFAAGAKRIRNHAVVNQDTLGDIKALQLENARLQRQLSELQAKQAEKAAARTAELEQELARAREEAEQQSMLFDQNNQEISTLKLENGLLKTELGKEKAQAAQLWEESVQLRSDVASLNHELDTARAQLAAAEEEAERLRQEVEGGRSVAHEADKDAHALRLGLERRDAELQRIRDELEATQKAMQAEMQTLLEEMSRTTRAEKALQRERDELARDLRRAQREAVDGSEHAAVLQARMQAENEEMYRAAQNARREAEQLKQQLSHETVATAKYRRMVGEISKLVEWAQQASSPGALGGRAATPLSTSVPRRASFGARLSPLADAGNGGNVRDALAAAAPSRSQGGKLPPSPGERRSPEKQRSLDRAVAEVAQSSHSAGSSISLSPARIR